MDTLSTKQRSGVMSRIHGKDTTPELIVRRLVHSLGYRYRLHVRKLPGSPDLVFASRRKVIFVHGCFWHRHSCRKGRSMPTTREEFWRTKLEANRRRDNRSRRALRAQSWKVLVIWECQTRPKKYDRLRERITKFLEA